MRRGHGSTKVPNVKLRPPPPKEKAKRRIIEEDVNPVDLDDVPARPSFRRDYSRVDKPFANVILCSTGIKDKVSLFQRASELGACAIENGMAVMTPDWVDETYALWLEGKDIDVEESMRKHTLPFLSGLTICLTGGDINSQQRDAISRQISSHGGVYSSSLTKQCTHLLVSAASYEAVASTEKVRFALRANKENKAHIHVLWLEWFWDCLTVSGKLEEITYTIETGKPKPKAPTLNQRLIHPSDVSASFPTPPAPPGVAVDLSKDAPEPGMAPSMSRVQRNEQQTALWHQLQIANLPGILSQSQRRPKIDISIPSEDEAMKDYSMPTSTGATPAIKLASPVDRESQSVLRQLAISKASSFNQLFDTTKTAPFNQPDSQAGPSMPKERRRNGIFEGMTFCLVGDARTVILQGAIESSGGTVHGDGHASEKASQPTWYIVRLNTGSRHVQEIAASGHQYVTECWVEECLHQERVCDPGEHVTFRPILVPTPIVGMHQMRLHISGLEESNALYAQRLARTLGASVAVVFSKKSTTHLLCPTPAGVKYEHAVRWGMPTLRLEWLYEIARTGTVPDAGGYHLSVCPSASTMMDATIQTPSPFASQLIQRAVPSPPQENIQPSSRLSPHPREAPAPPGPSPDETRLENSATETLSRLSNIFGAKRKSAEPDVEDKMPSSKKRTRPVTRVKSGDTSIPSTATGKSTFAPQSFNFGEPIREGGEEVDAPTHTLSGPLGESMRVTYEDPESRAEKRKLMKLIGVLPESIDPTIDLESPASGTSQPRPRPRTRKSTRQS
ncbi:hypothetical protein DACRYDRAFT_114056 [Dacryopinax primogenitus]|uniref:BRCT domain-containing protein n=1 Tax=Dacryopinax primogenitus (strain DJM 731) TaxID=1858805 RepID=M5GG16_DACPD|nr:uncharacterized protein DACRYDRAFT_114056 [Dacryopinax primogenitus]EJU04703.1 hypothetical protein DACRYDRAFT_114056 [Dacryopinax primogenitus]